MIEIYTRENCSFCTHAKTVMNNRGILYEEKKLGEHFTREELLTKFPSMKTYPVIVNNGTLIGGFDDFIASLHEGNIVYERVLNG